MDDTILNNDREYANRKGDSNSHGGYGGYQKEVHTTWDQMGQPHRVTQDGEYTGAQPTNKWTQWSDPYTTATATATESWISQVTSQSQTWSASETQTSTATASTTSHTSQTSTSGTTSSTSTSSTGTSSLPSSSTTSTSAPESASSSGLPLKTKLAIALPISILGTVLLLALLFFIRRRRSKHGSRSGPYMDIRDPSSSRIHVHSHSQIHSFSQGENDNPWDYLGPMGAGYGTSQPVIMGGAAAARNSRDTTRSSLARQQQQQIRGSHTSLTQSLPPSNRPSLSVIPTGSAAGFGFLPDPLHSHPNTPTTSDERDPSPGPGVRAGSIGLARTTTEEHDHDQSYAYDSRDRARSPSLDHERPQSPFDHPLDDAVSEISRVSSGRRRMLHGHGPGTGHYYRNVDDDSSVSSVSDDEDDGQVRNGARRG